MTSRCNDSSRLQDLIDINTVKTRYTRYLDAKRWQDWGNLFTEDVIMQTGDKEEEIISGRDFIVDFLQKNVADAITVHQVHAGEITFTGEDTAEAIFPMSDEVEHKHFHLRGFGFYQETFRRVDGEWRLARWRLLRTRLDWKAKSLPVKLVKFAYRIGLLGRVSKKLAREFHNNVYARMSPDDLP
jgi:hypothetical protein